MIRVGRMGVLVALALVCGGPASIAQDRPDEALRRDVERRFEVLPLRDGVALRPRTSLAGVRSIEVSGGTIALDGQAATGAELRQKLGADADLVLRLSYLSDAARRTLFALPAASTPTSNAPAAPTPPLLARPRPRRPIRPIRPAKNTARDAVSERGHFKGSVSAHSECGWLGSVHTDLKKAGVLL